MVKIDLKTERTKTQWETLLLMVQNNSDNILTRQEQDWYIEQIIYKLGIRNKNIEVLKSIEDGMPDIDDII